MFLAIEMYPAGFDSPLSRMPRRHSANAGPIGFTNLAYFGPIGLRPPGIPRSGLLLRWHRAPCPESPGATEYIKFVNFELHRAGATVLEPPYR